MKDNYKRTIDYLRLSLTDNCQLNCKYCVPNKKCISNKNLLKSDEIIKLANVFADLGIRKIKLTGGEPLLHPDVSMIITSLKAINGIEEVTITTNGILLNSKLNELISAGIDGINISLDTLSQKRYKTITGKNNLEKVLFGLNKARDAKLKIKINCVLIDSFNEDEVLNIAQLAKSKEIHVRFIQLMPIGEKNSLKSIPENHIKNILQENFGELVPVTLKIGNGPAHYFKINGFKGKIGFISAISNHFCNDCNRIRLTCTGFLKTCLYFNHEVDLKPFLHKESPEKLKQVILENLKLKPKKHHFNEKNNENREEKNMIQIGG